MKKLFITILLFPLLVKAQSSVIKSWDIVKTFMGMDSVTAQKIVKGSGYTYQRSFENIGLKFSEFSRGYTKIKTAYNDMAPDDIFLGSRNGIVDFIKMEVIDLTFNDYNDALKKDGYTLELSSKTKVDQQGQVVWINKDKGIKVVGYRQRDGNVYKENESVFDHKSEYRLDALFILRVTEKYCFPITLERQQELCRNIAYRSKSVDDDGIESYKYTPLLYELACIDPNTEREDAANAMQMFWYFNYSRMIGDIPGYNLGNRNILFYAVKADFYELLSAFFDHYKIDRNLLYMHYNKPVRLIDYANDEVQSRKDERPANKLRIQVIQDIADLVSGKKKK